MSSLAPAATEITGASLRAAASHFPTGVAVMATLTPSGAPVGCTVSSFISVSLEPPIVAVSLDATSATLDHVVDTGKFGISVLAAHQGAVAHIFSDRAIDPADRFVSSYWRLGSTQVPVIENALSTLECSVIRVVPAGDHTLVLGRVTDLFVGGWGAPLVHHQGALTSLNRH